MIPKLILGQHTQNEVSPAPIRSNLLAPTSEIFDCMQCALRIAGFQSFGRSKGRGRNLSPKIDGGCCDIAQSPCICQSILMQLMFGYNRVPASAGCTGKLHHLCQWIVLPTKVLVTGSVWWRRSGLVSFIIERARDRWRGKENGMNERWSFKSSLYVPWDQQVESESCLYFKRPTLAVVAPKRKPSLSRPPGITGRVSHWQLTRFVSGISINPRRERFVEKMWCSLQERRSKAWELGNGHIPDSWSTPQAVILQASIVADRLIPGSALGVTGRSPSGEQ